jgi:phosphatidylglycerol---prolipoprotein diacylglyceryl transferase
MTHNPLWHWLFEVLAYGIGFQLFLRAKRRQPDSVWANHDSGLSILLGIVLGAAAGSKILYWFDNPAIAFSNFPNYQNLMQGKSVVGGFLGGLLGCELAKYFAGVTRSSGDLLAFPMLIGLCIGRVGCFVAGLNDHTHGLPTNWVTGYDFGDGVSRHPTQIYEILAVIVIMLLLRWRRSRFTREGDLFKAALSLYLIWRLCVETIKPMPLHYGGLSAIQWACVAGLLAYGRHVPRLCLAMLGFKMRPAS